MKYLLSIVAAISLCPAAFELSPMTAPAIGSGLATTADFQTPLACFSHPASLAGTSRLIIETASRVPFGISFARQNAIGIAAPVGRWTLAAGAAEMGSSSFREGSVAVAGAGEISPRLQVGLTLFYFQLAIEKYGSSGAPAMSTSLRYRLSPDLAWSLLYRNVGKIGGSHLGRELPTIVATGMAFSPRDGTSVALELERDPFFPIRWKMGGSWTLRNVLSLSAGFASHPGQVTAAVTARLRTITIGYAVATHDVLPLTHAVSCRLGGR